MLSSCAVFLFFSGQFSLHRMCDPAWGVGGGAQLKKFGFRGFISCELVYTPASLPRLAVSLKSYSLWEK